MADSDSQDHERTPQRLVYQAYKHAAEERERVSAAPMLPDTVLDTQFAEIQYHAAVMELFNRLKPHLIDRPHFWEEVPLWHEDRESKRAEIADLLCDYYGLTAEEALDVLDQLEQRAEFPDIRPQDQVVRGLKNLHRWRVRTERDIVTENDVIEGETTKEVVRAVHMPREVAMRAHDALDEAAADLGFDYRPGQDSVKSRLEDDGPVAEEVESKR